MWLTQSIRLTVFASLALLVVFVSAQNTAKAQEDEGLRLSPAILDIPGKKGEATNSSLTLHNNSSKAIAITSGARTLIPEDSLIDESASERYRATDWIKLPIQDFLVAPNESLDVMVVVDIPENAVPGGHYALVTFRVVNEEPSSSGVKVSPEAAAVLLINVPGDIDDSIDIHSENTPAFTFGGVAVFSHTLMNHGNSHVTPIITTEIMNRHGEVVEVITQPIQLLLPNTKREVIVNWDPKGSLGKFQALTKVSYATPTKVAEVRPDAVRVLPGITMLAFGFTGTMAALNRFHQYVRKKNAKIDIKKSKSEANTNILKPKQDSNKPKTVKRSKKT